MAKTPLDIADVTEATDLPAGGFSSWLRETRNAQTTRASTDVPCGGCNACCKSSYFIHIAPEELQTLRRIPKALLFKAPGLPTGNVLMGYDENGRCPMLIDERCSIYEDRPQTCRTYDCRVFPAAGIDAGHDKALIGLRIRRWQFSHPSEVDRREHAAVQAAAAFLRDHADCFPPGVVPSNSTQLAVLAIRTYEVFVDGLADDTGEARSDLGIADDIMEKLGISRASPR